MIHGVKDQPVHENFTVSDSAGNLISGIDTTTGFTSYVYDPSGSEVTGLVSGFFTELGDGNYRYTFTPNVNGVWYVNVTNITYFPWGKNDDIYVDEADLTAVYEAVIRTLGLTHENFYIDNASYGEHGSLTSARVRIYDSAINVGTNTGVIQSYLITADETECGKFSFWSQVKI